MNQNEMSLHDYAEKTRKWAEQYLGNTYTVSVVDIPKNNGFIRKGLIIQDNIHNISPTIYLDSYYERFHDGEKFEDLWSEIEGVYEKAKIHKDFNIKELLNFELVKGQIYFSLINTEMNRELLEDVPHVRLHDLAIVFYIKVNMQQKGLSKIMIHNDLQNRWDIDVDELYEIALSNAEQLLPSSIFSLEEKLIENVLKKMDRESAEIIQGFFKRESHGVPLYVATNKIHINGAAVIVYKDVLKKFSEKSNSDVYILPCSIHEVLLAPASEDVDIDFLKEIVLKVNTESLPPEEILSDSVYFYNRETDCLEIL